MRHTSFAIAVFALLSSGTFAQNIPDAGALMRQTEQMLKQSQIQRNQQKRESLPPEMALSDSVSVTVQRFQFSGNRLLSTDKLQQVAQPYANRALTKTDLQHLMSAISEVYRQTGWMVQTYIPRQDLSGDEMTLQIIESIPPNKPMAR